MLCYMKNYSKSCKNYQMLLRALPSTRGYTGMYYFLLTNIEDQTISCKCSLTRDEIGLYWNEQRFHIQHCKSFVMLYVVKEKLLPF